MKKITVNFKNNGQDLEMLLINIIKTKLNLLEIDFEENNLIKFNYIDK